MPPGFWTLSGSQRGGFLIFPEMSNFMSPPAEPGLYLKEIIVLDFELVNSAFLTYFLAPSVPPGKPPILVKSTKGTAPPETCGRMPFHFSTLLY
jgi:hypothetical protein